jgi:transposase
LEEKLAILKEAFAPGAVVTDVARRWEVSTALIYSWRRQALGEPAGILPVRLVGAEAAGTTGGADGGGCVRVTLASGDKVDVPFDAPPGIVGAILRALR